MSAKPMRVLDTTTAKAGLGTIEADAEPTYDAMGDGPFWSVQWDSGRTETVHDDDLDVVDDE